MERIVQVIHSTQFKNIGLSFGFFYVSRKISNFINTKIGQRYPRFSNYILPIGYIYGLYMSKIYLELASNFPTHNFWKYLLKIYSNIYSFSYGLSFVTFIIGYPTINILCCMSSNYLSNYLSAKKRYIGAIVRVMLEMRKNLQENKNWDIILFNYVSIKTWEKPQPIINDETLNNIIPLKYANNHPSISKFIGLCSICRENIDTKKLHRELPCNHVFHPECVDTWLLQCNATCPICRKSILLR